MTAYSATFILRPVTCFSDAEALSTTSPPGRLPPAGVVTASVTAGQALSHKGPPARAAAAVQGDRFSVTPQR